MRIVVLVLALLIFAVPSWATCTTTTANLSQATIQTAINNAIPGDTICLPTGSATWTTLVAHTPSVVLSKGVTLQGKTSCTGTPVTCSDGTIINDGTTALAGEDPLYITGTNARVSGISFKDPRRLFDAGPAARMRCNNCRFDHNSFTQANPLGATRTAYIFSSPTTIQLIDHNYFKDSSSATSIDGSILGEDVVAPNPGGSASWAAPMTPGDPYATYIEDNHYDFPTSAYNGAYDAYSGARLVFRYNVVAGTNMGGHGFDSSPRSTLRQEVYRNTISNPRAGAIATWFQTRGGHHYVWQNNILSSNGSFSNNGFMVITNYRSDGTACSVCGEKGRCDGTNVRDQNTGGQEGYPCRDQVGRGPQTDAANDWPLNNSTPVFSEPLFPAYSWGNIFKGSQPTVANISVLSGASGGNSTRMRTYHMLNNRDYYMEVPSFDGTVGTGTGVLASRPATCEPGVAYFATDQGSWNRSGNGDGSGLLFKCTSTNTWTLSYTPYLYPHPLQTMQSNMKSADPPSGLVVN